MNTQSIDVKIGIYDVEGGYKAKISSNTLKDVKETRTHSSAIALFNDEIDPFVKSLRLKALQNGQGFQSHYRNFVQNKEQMVLSGMEANLDEARVDVNEKN